MLHIPRVVAVSMFLLGAQVLTPAAPSAGELNVQGGTSTAGNAHVISGSVRTGKRFSVIGALNNAAVVLDCVGFEFAHLTIRDLATLPAARLHPLPRPTADGRRPK